MNRTLTAAVLLTVALLGLLTTPVPAMQHKPMSKPKPPEGTIVVEAEDLLPATEATLGAFGRQEMGMFGALWGGNAQLFWTPDQVGAFLRIKISFPAEGRYRVILDYTAAPDYADYEASFDGLETVRVNGFAKRVSRASVPMTSLALTRGEHELMIRISGRSEHSTGLFVGLDRIRLVPDTTPDDGAPDAAGKKIDPLDLE